MSVDGTLGSLLQGVSQQPPAVRPEGKVTEQINFTSDVVQGLTSRPALEHRGTDYDVAESDLGFTHVEIEGDLYIMGFKNNVLRMWDLDGNAQTVTETDSGALAYIGDQMRTYVFEDTVFLANREVVVAKASSADTSSAMQRAGLAHCLGGKFSRTYSVTIRYEFNGAEVTGSYTTPDGTTAGDAAKTSSEYIMQEIETALNAAAAPALEVTTTLTRHEGILLVTDTTRDFTITASDGEDGFSLRAFTDSTDDLEDLPATAPHGLLVRITNNDEGSEDDFYMRFNNDITDTVGSGFGNSGVWEEWFNVSEVSTFDLTTMPHTVKKTGASTFSLERGAWLGRRVGDDETNEFSDIVGNAIRDLAGFQSRLVMLAGPYFATSRTKEPLDLFKKSVLTEIDTDPISISSTQEGTVNLDWIIPFDRDLVLMSDPGQGQFIISGANKMTPSNAAMVKTTAFEMKGGAKPVETGRTILFPFLSGIYSGIQEFFTNDEVATNGADTLTETLDRYIVGLVNHMQCSTNFNMAVFKTDSAAHSNVVWVYKYLWQNTEKLQSSWSKWQFPNDVRYFFFTGSELFVLMSEDSHTTANTNYVFTALDLDIPVNTITGYHVCLDRQDTVTVDVNSKADVPIENAAFIQGTGCADPGWPVLPTVSTAMGAETAGSVTHTFDADTVPDGAEVIYGLRFTRELKPTMPLFRNKFNGRPVPRTKVVISAFLLEYADTGYIKSVMNSTYRQNPVEIISDWFPLDDDPVDINANGLRSGIENIPWGERSDWSELTLTSDDVRPTTFIELEWVGHVYKGSRQ